MKLKKSSKLTKSEKDWQKKVEEKTKAEKVELEHSRGRERFERLIKRLSRKGNTTK